MEITIAFDDGRPDVRYDDSIMADESWGWDQKHIASTLVAHKGFPKGEPKATSGKQELYETIINMYI